MVNGLTLSRIPATILFNLNIIYGRNRLFICSLIFILIATSDILDGKLARHYKVASRLGSILDVATDFFFIFSASFLLNTQKMLSLSLVILIVFKFSEFCFTSYLISGRFNHRKPLVFDKTGRVAAVFLYMLPLFTIFLHTFFRRNSANLILFYTFLILTALSMISIYQRAVKIIQYRLEV